MKAEKEKTQKAREKAKYPKQELFVCESMGEGRTFTVGSVLMKIG